MFGRKSGARGETPSEDDETAPLQPTAEDFLRHVRFHSTECIREAYRLDRCVPRTDPTGALSSSLAEDVVSFCYLQCQALREHSTVAGAEAEALQQRLLRNGLRHMVDCIRDAHLEARLVAGASLEGCCRAANDFARMADQLELLWCKLCSRHPFLQDAIDARKGEATAVASIAPGDAAAAAPVPLGDAWAGLVRLLLQDAVANAERTPVFLLRELQRHTEIASELFSVRWERHWTDNQVALRLVQVAEAHLGDVRRFLAQQHLWCKALLAACRALVCFYVRRLVEAADCACRRRRRRLLWVAGGDLLPPFARPERAIQRMGGDIALLRDYFLQLADGNAALLRMLANELYILELIHEFLDSDEEHSIESFVVVIHKRTGADALVTRCFLADLLTLMAQEPDRAKMARTVSMLQPDLQLVSSRIQEQQLPAVEDDAERGDVSFVRLDEMLRVTYEDRIVQGMLPACWTCVPKVATDDGKVATARVRSLARMLQNLRWNRTLKQS